MKRRRAEVATANTTNKSPKRSKENNPSSSKNNKNTRSRTMVTQKGSNEETNLQVLENDFIHNHQQQQQQSMVGLEEIEWQLNSWPWGGGIIDEELLLGWFPFEDRDFLFNSFSENSKNSCCYHGWDDYNDLWQLQHTHEVPTCSSNN